MSRQRMLGNRDEVIAGLITGLAAASLFSAIALIIFLGSGEAPFAQRTRLTIGQVIATYFAGGMLGGALFGLLVPLGRAAWGRLFLGFIAAAPFSLVYLLLAMPRDDWFPAGVVIWLLASTILGVLPAWMWDRRPRS